MNNIQDGKINDYSILLDRRFTTFVKGIAIIMIILTHAHQPFSELPAIIKNPLSFCQMGTQIFLVLSCFGLCISYTNHKPRYFRFLGHRVFKVGISYWLAIVLYLVLALLSYLFFGDNILGTNTSLIGIVGNVFLVHGMIPDMSICNYVVRGGWFIGTIVCFYLIFPILYKIYFSTQSKLWSKFRFVLFPLIIQFLSFTIVYGLGLLYSKGIVHVNLICYNNSIIYFNILNQLPCICLGFSMYDLCVNCKKRISFSWLFSILFFGLSIFLFFFSEIHNYLSRGSFIIIPLIFGCGFVFLVLFLCPYISKRIVLYEKKPRKAIYQFGLYSFGIYLVHFIFAVFFEQLILEVFFIHNSMIWYIMSFILCLVFVFPLSYFSGKFFNTIVQKISNRIKVFFRKLQ